MHELALVIAVVVVYGIIRGWELIKKFRAARTAGATLVGSPPSGDQGSSASPQLSDPAAPSSDLRGRTSGEGRGEDFDAFRGGPGEVPGGGSSDSFDAPRFDVAADGTHGVWLRPTGGENQWR